MNSEKTDFKSLFGDFYVCVSMSGTACTENPLLRSYFVVLRLFIQIILKKKHWVKNHKQSGLVGKPVLPALRRQARESKFKASKIYKVSSRSTRTEQRPSQTTTKQMNLTTTLQCQALPLHLK